MGRRAGDDCDLPVGCAAALRRGDAPQAFLPEALRHQPATIARELVITNRYQHKTFAKESGAMIAAAVRGEDETTDLTGFGSPAARVDTKRRRYRSLLRLRQERSLREMRSLRASYAL